MNKITPEEKIDVIYRLIKENPEYEVQKTKERFLDGTRIDSFWNNLQTKIKHLKNTTLTKEETYLIYTMALIEEEKRQNDKELSNKSKIDQIYEIVRKNPSINLSLYKEKFSDGTWINSFWLNLYRRKKNWITKPNLTEEQIYIIQKMEKINTIQNRKTKIPYEEKINDLLQYVEQHPTLSINNTEEKLPDGTTIEGYWNYLTILARKWKKIENLNPKQQYLLYTMAQIEDKIRNQQFSKEQKMNYIYELVQKHPEITLSTCSEKFPDETKIKGFWNTIQLLVNSYSKSENIKPKDWYLIYQSAQIENKRIDAKLTRKKSFF